MIPFLTPPRRIALQPRWQKLWTVGVRVLLFLIDLTGVSCLLHRPETTAGEVCAAKLMALSPSHR